jgi:hypothetical protein
MNSIVIAGLDPAIHADRPRVSRVAVHIAPLPDGERASSLGEPEASLGEKGEGATTVATATIPLTRLDPAKPARSDLFPMGRGERSGPEASLPSNSEALTTRPSPPLRGRMVRPIAQRSLANQERGNAPSRELSAELDAMTPTRRHRRHPPPQGGRESVSNGWRWR